MENEKKKRDVVFAIFLIFIGSIFLLNTTGVVGWGIWEHILRFWPVFLILAGIKLIFEKSVVAEIVIAIITLLLFSFVALFSYISYTTQRLPFVPVRISQYIEDNPNLFKGGDWTPVKEVEKIEYQQEQVVESRNIDIQVGASAFTFSDDDELEDYLSLTSNFSRGYIEPSLSSEFEDDTLNILFKTTTNRRIFFWGYNFSSEFDLTAGQVNLATNVNIDLGAGSGKVNLQSLNLQEMKCKIGAGKLEITVDETAIPEKILLDLGAGKTILNIPENVGFEMSYELGVGKISMNSDSIADFIGEDTSFKSSNYDEATQIINIVAKVGVGALEINQN